MDLAALRPYFESERVLQDGVFLAATRLYGITFTERPDLVGYHPDVRVFEVHEEDGRPVGLYLLDLYTRDSKNGGAWMNSLVDQADLLESPTAVVVNNLNVAKPAPGEPTLLGYDETRTLFHEFGHALHGLLARVRYPSAAGTAVFRDFVEFPSQVNEMWMLWPEVLAEYAVHHETGEPIPAAVLEKLEAAQTFNEGFATSEMLAAVAARPRLARAGAAGTASTTSPPSRPRRWPTRAWTSPPSRRGTRRRTSLTSSPARPTAPATTPTSGARCSTRTRSSGSRRTAASPAPTATATAST